MPKLPFTVAARTAKLIGQENFANADGAIIELVKNAYDADASHCIIVFDNSTDLKHQAIYIIDNGTGMTQNILQNEWMTIGTNNKKTNHTSSETGRVRSGAKGIGRFALDRLGKESTIYTFSQENKEKIIWKVAWDKFNVEDLKIHEVKANIREIQNLTNKKTLLKKFGQYEKIKEYIESIKDDFLLYGTIIKIEHLKDIWSHADLNNLYKNLETLMPPKEQASEFKIHLFSTLDTESFGKVENPNFDDYDYKIDASYNPQENHLLTIKIFRQELDKNKLFSEYSEIFADENMRNYLYTKEAFAKDYIQIDTSFLKLKSFANNTLDEIEQIGKFDFTFYFLKNTISDDSDDSLVKYPYNSFTAAERKNWLNKYGGIKVFRDNFRVRPYGEKGDDWLKLGQRQAQSPGGAGQRLGGYRIRPNQISGTINISRLENINFEDKSGREGIQENATFDLFKNVIIEIISYFEDDRNKIMNSLYKLNKKRFDEENAREKALLLADEILTRNNEYQNFKHDEDNEEDESKQKSQFSEEEQRVFAKATKIYELEIEEKNTEIRLLRNLASVGLIISSFSHEVHSLRMRLVPRNEHLLKSLKKFIQEEDLVNVNKYDNPFVMLEQNNIEDIKLKHWLDYSLNALKKDKRSRKIIHLDAYFKEFIANWQKALSQRKIEIALQFDESFNYLIKAFEVDLDIIFNNLLSNSIAALKTAKPEEGKKILISMSQQSYFIDIVFSDNGIGLSSIYKDSPEKILNALETSKVDKHGNSIGTGLGLYLVKSTIEEYKQSKISILSPTNGFSIKIILPLYVKENLNA